MLQEFISDLYSYRNRIGLLIGHYSISLMRAYISGACTVFWLNGDNEAYEAFDRSWVMSIVFRTFSQSTPWRNCQMIFQDSLSQSPKTLLVATALAA